MKNIKSMTVAQLISMLVSIIAGLNKEQLITVIQFVQNLVCVDTDKALVKSAPEKVVKPFVKATPNADKVGYSIRMTELNKGRWGGINNAFKSLNGGKSAWNKDTQTWEFKTKKACKQAYDTQVEYAKAHADYPCVVEMC